MDPKKIARINELAKKKKTEGLTPEEAVEQAKLREEYIEGCLLYTSDAADE